MATIACKVYQKLGIGPFFIPHVKNLQVITDFLAKVMIFLQKPGFQSGLDFWKLGLEWPNRKNKATFTPKTFWASGMKVALFFRFSASKPKKWR